MYALQCIVQFAHTIDQLVAGCNTETHFVYTFGTHTYCTYKSKMHTHILYYSLSLSLFRMIECRAKNFNFDEIENILTHKVSTLRSLGFCTVFDDRIKLLKTQILFGVFDWFKTYHCISRHLIRLECEANILGKVCW